MITFLLILFFISVIAMFLLCKEILWGIRNGKKKLLFFEQQISLLKSVQINSKQQKELSEMLFFEFKNTNKSLLNRLLDLNLYLLQKNYSPKE